MVLEVAVVKRLFDSVSLLPFGQVHVLVFACTFQHEWFLFATACMVVFLSFSFFSFSFFSFFALIFLFFIFFPPISNKAHTQLFSQGKKCKTHIYSVVSSPFPFRTRSVVSVFLFFFLLSYIFCLSSYSILFI